MDNYLESDRIYAIFNLRSRSWWSSSKSWTTVKKQRRFFTKHSSATGLATKLKASEAHDDIAVIPFGLSQLSMGLARPK